MKIKMSKNALNSRGDIWNAVIHVLVSTDYQNDSPLFREASLVFHYYSEVESGGHECLLNWQSQNMGEIGINTYVNHLSSILLKIGAQDYAAIVTKYGVEMFEMYIQLENEEITDVEFYKLIEIANSEYEKLESKLDSLLETYFIQIHTEMIEVIE
ncbi:DMP19 family protein [Cytobacillus purgationiresistens]|uniref:DNA mimic protein DMP19 C-terminal domain-containing protein n=1 Tax=Cytobacillus purgationiresistens TaxID=863449 RepID=A0ABU0AAH3_9BACI|nr:hypothetical protein [Cytobacillus purgationiresistens]MDQ0268246.1 hypothetical protein [Cytobacillus purgationiresistens]